MTRPLLILTLAGLAAPGAAQTSITLMHDNDEWAHTEREYASGSRLAAIDPSWGQAPLAQALARILPGIEPGDKLSAGFGAGHYFYVPENMDTAAPLANARPYGGWLHVSGLLAGETSHRLDTWKLDVGVVGPSAQSEELEEFFHNIFDGRDMNGWDNQITDRLGVNASWERRWRNLADLGGGWQADLSPAIGLEAGNVSVAAATGLTLRLGSQLDADFGAPRAGSLGGSLSRRSGGGWSAYLFASISGRYQPHDIFLDEEGGEDSDPIRGGEAISRDKLRGEASLGAVLAYGAARLTFAFTEESKRYDQQSEPQRYGEVTLGWSF
jgi:lipid A 3-O-deacylase